MTAEIVSVIIDDFLLLFLIRFNVLGGILYGQRQWHAVYVGT